MVNFGLLAAEIVSLVWGAPGNFDGFRVLAALLHGTLVVGVSQTLRRWTEGSTYIRQGGHHVGHWPTFLFIVKLIKLLFFRLFCYRIIDSAEIKIFKTCQASHNKKLYLTSRVNDGVRLTCGWLLTIACVVGSYAGAVLGMPLSGIMTDYAGWEACFYFYGTSQWY